MILLVFLIFARLIKGECEQFVAYSECIDNKRDIVVYYSSSSSSCGNDTIIRGIQCNFTCKNGYFLNLKKVNPPPPSYECERCPLGYESAGKTVIYDDFQVMPPGFSTRCTGENCKNWTSKESILTPGFAVAGTSTYLTILFDILQEEGSIITRFSLPQVSASSTFDAYFDGELISEEFHETTLFYDHTHSTLYGRHNLTFQFSTQNSDFITDIGPRITRVEIDGSEYLATECKLCPDGYHFNQTAGIGFCTRCPRDQYRVANASNATDLCRQCASGEYANPGSAKCIKRKPCKPDDYSYKYTRCSNGKRTKQYYYVEPIICDIANYTLPVNESVDCSICDRGLYKTANGQCLPCPAGTYRSDNMSDASCVKCEAGTHAGGTTFIRNLQEIEDQFNTSCQDDHPYADDDCAEPGWRAREGFIDSGNYHTGPVTVYMNKNVSSSGFGRVDFLFTTHLQNDSYFMFEITEAFSDDENLNEVFFRQIWTSENNSVQQRGQGYFYSNVTRLEWFFIKEGKGIDSVSGERISDYVTIEEIQIVMGLNSTIGGATECEECPSGLYAPEGSIDCLPCQAGTAALNHSAACTACTDNTASNDFAAECIDCKEFSHANDQHTECVLNECGFSINDTYTFDLSGLMDNEGMYGPISVPNFRYSFYINICTKERSDIYCKGAFNNISTYACYITNSGFRLIGDVGSILQFGLFEDPDNERYGVNLTYSHGGTGNCGTPGDRSSSEIDIICSIDSFNSAVHSRAENFVTDGCHYHFEWFSDYGCRLCHQDDFIKLEGPCVNKKRNISYAQTGTPCAHGYSSPDWYLETCKPAVGLSAGVIVGIVIGALVILGAAAAAIIFFVRKNRAIRFQLYQKAKFSLAVQDSAADENKGDGGFVNSGNASGDDNFKVSF